MVREFYHKLEQNETETFELFQKILKLTKGHNADQTQTLPTYIVAFCTNSA